MCAGTKMRQRGSARKLLVRLQIFAAVDCGSLRQRFRTVSMQMGNAKTGLGVGAITNCRTDKTMAATDCAVSLRFHWVLGS